MSGSGSLRIKIPKAVEQPSTSRQTEPSRKRHSKRRVVSDEEEKDGDDYPGPSQRNSPPAKRPRRSLSAHGGEEEVDVDGPSMEDTRFLALADPPEELERPPLKKKKNTPIEDVSSRQSSYGPPKRVRKRSAKVVWSSDEDYSEMVGNGDMDIEDEDFDPECKKQHGTKKEEKEKHSSVARTNGIVKVKGGKKGKKEEKEIVFKDERKLSTSSANSSTKKTPAASLPPASLIRRPRDIDDTKDGVTTTTGSPPPTTAMNTPAPTTPVPNSVVDSDQASAIVPPSASTSSLPPIPKRKKLPPIKKNKPTGDSAVSTPLATPSYSKKGGNDAAKTGVSASVGDKKPGAADTSLADDGLADLFGKKKVTQEKTEFDLRNKDIYAELFKSTGGAPRSGIKSKDKILERRKELDKMREEARAKRLEEARHSFSLTSAIEKVGRFEDLLKERKSSAAYPNLLCGKVREMWEGARREREWKKKESSPELRR